MLQINGKMTKEQAINYLFSSGFSEEQVDGIVKAFEQEPVIDKIRAEILEKCFDVPYKNQAFDYGLKIVKWSDVREILDKYKAESEETWK